MRLKSYILNEEYLTRVKDIRGGSHEVWINPSFKELMEIVKNEFKVVRFIGYKNNLYAWYGYKLLMHNTFWKNYMKRDLMEDMEKLLIFPGIAIKKGAKFVLEETMLTEELLDMVNYKINEDEFNIVEKKFEWINKYIDISNLKYLLQNYWKD